MLFSTALLYTAGILGFLFLLPILLGAWVYALVRGWHDKKYTGVVLLFLVGIIALYACMPPLYVAFFDSVGVLISVVEQAFGSSVAIFVPILFMFVVVGAPIAGVLLSHFKLEKIPGLNFWSDTPMWESKKT